MSALDRDLYYHILKSTVLKDHKEMFFDISPNSIECHTSNRRLIIHFNNDVCVFGVYIINLSNFILQPFEFSWNVDLSVYPCDDKVDTHFHVDSDSRETDDDDDDEDYD